MNISALHIGQRVKHPQYGPGTVKSIAGHAAEIAFDDGPHTVAPETSGLEPAEAQMAVAGLNLPLAAFIEQTVEAAIQKLGLGRPDELVEELAARWHRGRMLLHPADPALQPKEVPVETFFHKIVMMRNNLRVLEQKINGHDKLSDAEKVELQQYISRCYGSMTTFNLLFKRKEDQFGESA